MELNKALPLHFSVSCNLNVSKYLFSFKYFLSEKFEQKTCNTLSWSPTGQFIVLAALRSSSYTLEFVDTSDFTITNTQEHFKLTDIEWDPTGRYVATIVSYWTNKVCYFYIYIEFLLNSTFLNY